MMYFMVQLLLVFIGLFGIVHADDICTPSNAIVIETLSAGDPGPGGVSNTVIIGLGQGLNKAGIQNLKRKRHDDDGGKGKDGGDNDGSSNANQIECSGSGSGSETCYSYQAIPICYNYATGNFHSAKISGSAANGNYNLSDGQKGNLYLGPYPTGTSASTTGLPATTSMGNGGEHGNGRGSGNDDTKQTPATTTSLRSASSTGIAAFTTSGVLTITSGDILTTTVPANAVVSTSSSLVDGALSNTASSSPKVASNGVGRTEPPNLGVLSSFAGLILMYGLFLL